jgi:hypothetical protein
MKRGLLALVCAAAYAQTASVEGRVLNALTGEPLRKAAVTAQRGSDGPTVETGSNGEFRLDGLAPGMYALAAERAGYLPKRAPEVTVAAGQPLTAIELSLTPAAVLSGRTLDPDGDPVSHMTVEAMQYTYTAGKKTLRKVRAAVSDDRGRYRIFDLPPGRYYLQASLTPAGQGTPLLAYYPAAVEPARAVAVEATAGADLRSLDIRLRALALFTVRVRVANGRDWDKVAGVGRELVPRFMPRLYRRGSEAMSRLFYFLPAGGQNDRMEIPNVPPGEYSFSVQQPDRQPGRQLFARHNFQVVDADVEFVATLASAVPVTMVFEGVTGAGARLEPVDPNPFNLPRSSLQPDGRLLFADVAPDRYLLRSAGPAGSYLKSIRFGERELDSQMLDLTGALGTVVVRFAGDGGAIAGLVLDSRGKPAGRASIVVEPAVPGWPDHVKAATSDEQGHFQIPDVAPGDYQVLAWHEGELDETRAVPVHVSAGAESRVSLKCR